MFKGQLMGSVYQLTFGLNPNTENQLYVIG